jgi:subtilase family serine protease
MVAMSPASNKWYWTEADWQFEFANHVLSLADGKIPEVMSISYAWYELDQCDISPGVKPCTGVPVPAGSAAFVAATNALYAKIGARGISMLSASGDSGAHGRTDPGCTDAKTRPDYPAASPYITAVGATELQGGTTNSAFKAPICKATLKCASGGTEVVASNKMLAFFSSGGGFSTLTPMPAWQKTVVEAYTKSKPVWPLPSAADTNYSNYGFPVLSALGHNFYVEVGGQVQAVDGTSAATPLVAGLITSMNGWRKANGKPTLGFLNPLLYAVYDKDPTAFNDVTVGDNSCTESACPCPAKTGFGAIKGWDASTGLGTPNYEKIKATLTAMGI